MASDLGILVRSWFRSRFIALGCGFRAVGILNRLALAYSNARSFDTAVGFAMTWCPGFFDRYLERRSE